MQRQAILKKNKNVSFAVDDDVHLIKSFKGKARLWFSPFELKKIEKQAFQLHSRMESMPPTVIEWLFGESVRGLESCFIKEEKTKTKQKDNKNKNTNTNKKPSSLQARITTSLVASVVWALSYSDMDDDGDDGLNIVGNLSREEYYIVARAYSKRSERDAKCAIERARLDEKFVNTNIRSHLNLELEEGFKAPRTPQEGNLELIVGRHTGLTMNFALMAC